MEMAVACLQANADAERSGAETEINRESPMDDASWGRELKAYAGCWHAQTQEKQKMVQMNQ